jgi:coproporphyrinogen III oxidase-like Fe-S oxidoreductase
MYTNIPTSTVVKIIRDTLTKEENPPATIQEINTVIKIILEQNYFQHNNQYYKQKEGLAMGAPSSSILSEIYLRF